MARRRDRAARAADAAQPQPATSAESAAVGSALSAGPAAMDGPAEVMHCAEDSVEVAPVVYEPTDADRFAQEAMRMHYQEGVPREEVDRWYAEKIGVAWQPTPDDAPAEHAALAVLPREQPAASPYLLRRRLIGNVTAHGFTVDGVARDHWWVGEVADFKPAVVESAPQCFEPFYL